MLRVTPLQRGKAAIGGASGAAAATTAAAAGASSARMHSSVRRAAAAAAPSAAAAAVAARAAHPSASTATATAAHRCIHARLHAPQRVATRCFSSTPSAAASADPPAADAQTQQPPHPQGGANTAAESALEHDDTAYPASHEPFYDTTTSDPAAASAATADPSSASAAAARRAQRPQQPQQHSAPAATVWTWGAGFLGGMGRDSYEPSPMPQPVEFSRIGALHPEMEEKMTAAARAAAGPDATSEAIAAAVAAARPDASDPPPVPAFVASNWGRNVMLTQGGSIYEWGWRAPFRLMLKVASWNRWMPWVVAAMQRRRKGLRSLCGAEPLRAVRMPGWGVEVGDPPAAPRPPPSLDEAEDEGLEHEQQQQQQQQQPEEPLQAVAAACGSDFSAVLGSDGQVYTWGNNFYGQLGQSFHLTDAIALRPQQICHYQNQHPNESLARHVESGQVPLPRSYPATPLVAVAAGFAHTLLLTKAGQVYACGKCDTGALGITHIYRDSKRLFLPHLIPVTDAFAAGEHGSGELGIKVRADDLGESALTPTQLAQNDPTIVDTYIGPVAAVAAGMKHSLFLGESGALYACGSNGLNELGNSTFHAAHGLVPVHLPLLHAPVPRRRGRFRAGAGAASAAAAAAGDAHAQAQSEGYESFFTAAALGHTEERVVKISAGLHHSLALTSLGHVYAWGLNQQGQCGVAPPPEGRWNRAWFANVVSPKAKPPTLRQAREREDAARGPAPADALAPYRAASLDNLAPVNSERARQVQGITLPPTRILLYERAHELGLTREALGQVVDIMAGFHDSVLLTDRGYCIMFGGGLAADQALEPYVFRLDRPAPGVGEPQSKERTALAERVCAEWGRRYRVKQVAFGLGHAVAVVQSAPQAAARAAPTAATPAAAALAAQ